MNHLDITNERVSTTKYKHPYMFKPNKVWCFPNGKDREPALRVLAKFAKGPLYPNTPYNSGALKNRLKNKYSIPNNVVSIRSLV